MHGWTHVLHVTFESRDIIIIGDIHDSIALESDIGKILPVMYCSMVPNTCTIIFQVLSQSQCRSNTEKHHPPFEVGLVTLSSFLYTVGFHDLELLRQLKSLQIMVINLSQLQCTYRISWLYWVLEDCVIVSLPATTHKPIDGMIVKCSI